MMNASVKNLISGVLLIGLGGWLWMYTGTFPELQEGYPGPALFPRVIAVGLVLAGLSLVGGSLRRLAATRQRVHLVPPAWDGLLRLGLGIGLVVLYPLMQGGLGFIPTVSILSFVIAVALKARLVVAALTAVCATFLLYWLFTGLLGVPLS